RCHGLLLAARGDLDGAAEHFDHALLEHARLEMPFELARTLLCLGRVQRRRKLRLSAREALGRALDTFEAIGSPLFVTPSPAPIGARGRPSSRPASSASPDWPEAG